MNEANLLAICGAAFSAVFLLLTFLAGVMKLITMSLPHQEPVPAADDIDASLVAAINVAVGKVYAGAAVTEIKEIK